MVLLGLLGLLPQGAQSQGVGVQPGRVVWLMERLRDQMWTYRQELNFFQRAPEYQQLVELRYRLRGLAMSVAQSGGGDFRSQHGAAREMEQAARDLYRLTRQLESRTDLGARDEVRRRADQLTEQAVEIRVIIGRLHEAVRLDEGGYQPGRDAGGLPQPGRPLGRPGDVR